MAHPNIPGPDTFNAALREAVSRRAQWAHPIVIWMAADGSSFDARANTVPPADPTDTCFMELQDQTLDWLSEVLDDDAAFDDEVTQILQDQIDRMESTR